MEAERGPPNADPRAIGTVELPLLSSHRLKRLGLVGVALVMLALLAWVSVQYQQGLRHTQERHELMARVLEDHTTRTLDGVVLGLAGISALVGAGETASSPAVQRAMKLALVNLIQVRSFALLDAQGGVLYAEGDEGRGHVDLGKLGPLPSSSQPVLGRIQLGRGLPRLRSDASAPAGLTSLPMVQAVAIPGGARVYVVAVLNPDYFANAQEQTLNNGRLSAALVSFEGQCVASTNSADTLSGGSLERLLPTVSQGGQRGRMSWVGIGLGNGERVASVRALRSYPLWVMVDEPQQELVRRTQRETGWVAAGFSLLALLMLMLTQFASRVQAERETAQAALRESQARLAARGRELDGLFASVTELIFRADPQGRIQFINARWTSTTGRPQSDAIGRPLQSLFSLSSQATLDAYFQTRPVQPLRERQLIIERPDGMTRRLDLTLVPLMDEGQLMGYAGSAVDVTELLESQAQLQAQLAFNSSLIESSPLPVVVRDVHNIYLRVNRAWEAFTGRNREQVIGTLAALAYSPEHARVHESKDQELLGRGQGEIQYEAQLVRCDGHLRDVYITKALITDVSGKAFAIVAAFMDISEIREAERATRSARDAAEATSLAKSEFIANVSHELRTPLQAILGFSELGVRRAQAQARLGALFSDVHRAGHRMLTLVNDLLDMSKLDRKGIDLDIRRHELRPIVLDTLAELQPLATSRSVQFEISFAAGPWPVQVDVLRLGQVLRNLLANAIRFTPPLGQVDIEAQRVERDGGVDIQLQICDRGPGIPEGEVESIFEAFVQSSRTKDGGGGTGLGLTISRRIVEAHGGRLWAANRTDGGAIMTLILPALVPAELGRSANETKAGDTVGTSAD